MDQQLFVRRIGTRGAQSRGKVHRAEANRVVNLASSLLFVSSLSLSLSFSLSYFFLFSFCPGAEEVLSFCVRTLENVIFFSFLRPCPIGSFSQWTRRQRRPPKDEREREREKNSDWPLQSNTESEDGKIEKKKKIEGDQKNRRKG